MTQIAFLRKADMPTNQQIQDVIKALGYDFKILEGLEKQIDQDGLECSINGHQTFFESYLDGAKEAIAEYEADWINDDITDQDVSISFVWGADGAAGASIMLISIALIELSSALIYYLDDEMKFTKEMLVDEVRLFLNDL